MMLPSIARNVIPLSVCSIWRSTSAPMFAPTAATAMTNYVLGKAGFSYVPQIPSLAHQFLDGTITAEGEATLTAMQSAQNFTGMYGRFLYYLY